MVMMLMRATNMVVVMMTMTMKMTPSAMVSLMMTMMMRRALAVVKMMLDGDDHKNDGEDDEYDTADVGDDDG